MMDGCRHRAAAASINWFASMLKGKSGSDRTAALSVLSNQFNDMVESHCRTCTSKGACHDLDAAHRVLTEKHVPVSGLGAMGPSTTTPGALLIRRASKRPRLVRPTTRY